MPSELISGALHVAYEWSHVVVLVLLVSGVVLFARQRVKKAALCSLEIEINKGEMHSAQDLARFVVEEGGATSEAVRVTGEGLAPLWVPGRGELRLPSGLAGSRRASAFAFAAHESGMALLGLGPFKWLVTLRFWAIVLAGLGNRVSWLAVFGGMLVGYPGLSMAGAKMLVLLLLCGLSFLPLEWAGSRRAIKVLSGAGDTTAVISSRQFQESMATAAWDPVVASLIPWGQVPATSHWW